MSGDFFTRHKDTIDGIKTLLEIVGVPVAVVWFLWNYTAQVNAQRVAASNQLVATFFGTEVTQAKLGFEQEFTNPALAKKLQEASVQAARQGNVCAFHNATRGLVDGVGMDKYLRLDSFFHSVSVCMESGGCDTATICAAMVDDVNSFRNFFCTITEERAQSLGKPVATHYDTILSRCTAGQVPKGFCEVLQEKQGSDRLDLSQC